MFYRTVRSNPCAKFHYKGSHSHPVRRTILVIETTSNHIRGYELREGSLVRELKKAPIKTYKKSKIAKKEDVTTLKRLNLLEMLKSGV